MSRSLLDRAMTWLASTNTLKHRARDSDEAGGATTSNRVGKWPAASITSEPSRWLPGRSARTQSRVRRQAQRTFIVFPGVMAGPVKVVKTVRCSTLTGRPPQDASHLWDIETGFTALPFAHGV